MSNVTPINISLLEWFNNEMQASGLTEERVAHSGITIFMGGRTRSEPSLPGFRIPYHTQGGDLVPNYYRLRLREPELNQDADNYNAPKLSKYWQPKGQGQLLYWPRVLGVDHFANLSNMSAPLFICEGERKALKLQCELIAKGIQASAVAVPGVRPSNDLIEQIKRLNFLYRHNGEECHRPVFLVFDFNDKGTGEERTRECENKMRSMLRAQGADVILLRWELNPDSGPQKIDDWLVAGGNIVEATDFSLQRKADTEDELYNLMLGINQHYALLNGQFVVIDGESKGTVLNNTQFFNEHGHLFVEQFVGKRIVRVYAAREWIDWADKRTMKGFCFVPPPLGEPVQDWVDGHLNIAPGWADFKSLPWDDTDYPTHLIDTLLENFCEGPEHFKWLRQHIAYTLLHPNENTSNVVILCGGVGTGKSLLMDSFRKLAREDMTGGLAKSVRLDRKDDFNKEMEGTVIAIYEEPLKKSGKDVESIIKNLTGSKTIEIRKMRTDAYVVPNYVHLFVTMNLRYLAHLGKDDRRCNFFLGKQRISMPDDPSGAGNGFGKVYDEFLKGPVFYQTWALWADTVDLEGYNPQVLGPPSQARSMAIGFSSTNEEDFFSCEAIMQRDVWSQDQLQQLWEREGNKPLNSTAFGRLLTANGWTDSHVIKDAGKAIRVRARSLDWDDRPHAEWVEEFKKAPGDKY